MYTRMPLRVMGSGYASPGTIGEKKKRSAISIQKKTDTAVFLAETQKNAKKSAVGHTCLTSRPLHLPAHSQHPARHRRKRRHLFTEKTKRETRMTFYLFWRGNDTRFSSSAAAQYPQAGSGEKEEQWFFTRRGGGGYAVSRRGGNPTITLPPYSYSYAHVKMRKDATTIIKRYFGAGFPPSDENGQVLSRTDDVVPDNIDLYRRVCQSSTTFRSDCGKVDKLFVKSSSSPSAAIQC